MEEPTKKVKRHKANIPRESREDDVHRKHKDKRRTKKKNKSSDQIESDIAPSEELNSKPRGELKSRTATKVNNEESAPEKVNKKRKEMDKVVEVSDIGAVDDMKRTKKKKHKRKKYKTGDYIESGVTQRDDLKVTTGGEIKSKNAWDSKEENSEEIVTEKVKKKRKKSNSHIEVIPIGVVDDKKGKKKKKKVSPVVQDGLEKILDGSENGRMSKNRVKSVKETSEGKNNKEGSDAQTSVNPEKPKSSKKVRFADNVETFPTTDDNSLIHGKRFSPEEDETIKEAIKEYIEVHELGEDGQHKILYSKKYPEVKGCWKEIALSLPRRPRDAIYNRAHRLLERGEEQGWTLEDYETMRNFYATHGPQWKKLAELMGRDRIHVKDAFRRIKFRGDKEKGCHSKKVNQEEYQKLFDLVNIDLQLKEFEKKKSQHGMLRDNIGWGAIADSLATRSHAVYCGIWYSQLVSPMVADGLWADSDDIRLIGELIRLDKCCMEDVDWDSLIEDRPGDICRKRWTQMVKHIGGHKKRTFAEQVEELSKRYCKHLLEAREEFENRPYDDLPK